MLSLKTGVRVLGIRPELLLAVIVAERAYAEAAADCVITACVDSKHSRGSLHYSGAAVDLRTNNLHPGEADKIIARLRACLGADFDVLLESDHIHIEFQPKEPFTA